MSDDSEDDYAQFGTPLDPLDEDDCPRKKAFTIEEQFAKDQYGRRRFHGAFTGGFSAGFFNTVGSLEGWKPSSFKSSKSEKAAAITQKPENFMDEEDMGDFGIAPSVLKAKEDFSNDRALKRKHDRFYDSSAFGVSLLKNILQPVRETIGIKLLRKMGWKPGQGVGPRVTKSEKKQTSKLRKKVYGCLPAEGMAVPNSDDDGDDDDDEEYENITFAPDDYLPHVVSPKDNLFGIGYRGLDKRSILSVPQSKSDFQMKSKLPIRGQAFGVGAFEEEDDDIYNREDMSQYDFSLGSGSKDEDYSSGHVHGEGLFDGFVLALRRTIKKVFPPPVLPKDYKAIHKSRISRFEPVSNRGETKKCHLSPERENSNEETAGIQIEARKITQSITSAGGRQNFKPFISDVDKQDRYEKYLKLIAVGKKDALTSLQPITMTEWERERERIEFEQAAKLFKPLTGVMEDRFVSAKQTDDLNDPLAKVEKLRQESEEIVKAAKMNMFGRLTRAMEDWKPASLLCKRFNIPELNVNEIPVVKKKPKYSIFDNLPPVETKPSDECAADAGVDPGENAAVEEEEVPKHEDGKREEEHGVDISDPKNKIDLFNAIFLDSDSEDETVETGSKLDESNKRLENEGKSFRQEQSEILYEETIKNEKRNTSPARGIFENLDYDRLASSVGGDGREGKDDVIANESERSDDEMNSVLVYGPKLPDKLTVNEKKVFPAPEVDVACWIEKSHHAEHKKKSKKSKKSKHKSKHKHKKARR